MPNEIVPLKNCTWATLPSLSEASAVIVISAGAVKVGLLVGLVIATVGGVFVGRLAPDKVAASNETLP